ncbi:MAG: putative CRISPR-associated protein [Armatimonadetes bacterium]|nr:putative CRISPR-associated protein [Armatimonadota bacterium]
MSGFNTFIVATVGTSMLTNLRRELAWRPDQPATDREAEEAFHQASAFLRQQDPAARVCGAEINSINYLLNGRENSAVRVEPPVELCLLVSDTPEGEWSGRVLKHYFEHWDSVCAVNCRTIEGLQHTDPKRFAHTGLRNLVRLAAWCLSYAHRRQPAALRLIDATGGYKAQISFAGLLGQALHVPVVYLFEQFPYCIEMPPLPVSFDRSLWLEHYWLFKRLSGEDHLPVAEVPRADVDDRIWQLLDRETIDGVEYVALSPILEVMHQGFELQPPENAEKPPPSDLAAPAKLHIKEAEMPHAPKGSRQRMERLALLDWVTRVENVKFVDTARSCVKPGATQRLDEILLIHSDGNLGLEIKLTTTCTTSSHRAWCLEHLRRLLAE